MLQQNPLQVVPTVSSSSFRADVVSNKLGRPRKENVVNFGPQPQSMISKIMKLNKIKADGNFLNINKHGLSSPIFVSSEKQNHEGLIHQKHM